MHALPKKADTALKFKRTLKAHYGLSEICFVPFLNLAFLLFLIFIASSGFLVPVSFGIKLPKAMTSQKAEEKKLVILITGENLIYFKGKIVTGKELRQELAKNPAKSHSVLIKADRRASLGEVADLWNLCRQIGIEEVNIASTP